MKKTIIVLCILCAAGLGYFGYRTWQNNLRNNIPGIAHGNGRLEATEVDVATKISERIEKILVEDGTLVKKGDVLAIMQTNVLRAELAQAQAEELKAVTSEASAKAKIEIKKGELDAAKAVVEQKESSAANAKKRFERAEQMIKTQAISSQAYDNDKTVYLTTAAELAAAKAAVKQAEAEINSAVAEAKGAAANIQAKKADVARIQADLDDCKLIAPVNGRIQYRIAEAQGAAANIQAMKADVARIQADIDDCELIAPVNGRIQYRIAETGEVLSSGGRVLNLVDLTDAYMTFFLPAGVAGKVAIGADARILLDALPNVAIPAKISFVASVAQFTPKTVETQLEREKLMFRVKAKIDPALLSKYIEYVKTGLPGVAYVKINPEAQWPDFLKTNAEKADKAK